MAVQTHETLLKQIRDGVAGTASIATDTTWTWLTGQATASGDTSLIAAPGAGVRIVIQILHVQNTTSTATTVIVKAGSTAQMTLRNASDGDGVFAILDPVWMLPANTALLVNLSAANAHIWTVRYRTEAV